MRALCALAGAIVGGNADVLVGGDRTTALPVDEPPPQIVWASSVCVFTGKFAFGPQAACERSVEAIGGRCERSITKRTNYLVIGTFGSRDWVHTSFGRTIQKVVDYRDKGVPITIIAEDHRASSL